MPLPGQLAPHPVEAAARPIGNVRGGLRNRRELGFAVMAS